MMDLSIVILHHGTLRDVTRNLEALKHAILPEQTEVFVINNGRRGCNAEIPVEPNINFDLRFFEIPNKGYPQGNNFGMKEAKGRLLCILNPDIVVERNTFKLLVEYLEKNKHVGIVGPKLVYPDGIVQDSYRKFPFALDLVIKRTFLRKIFRRRMRRYLMWDKDPNETEAVDWLVGAFHLFSRKTWEKIGPKNTRYFLFMSDVELCRKAWDKGLEVHYVAEAQCLHNDERVSDGGVKDLWKNPILRAHVKDALKYYFKWRGKALPKRCPSASRY